MTIQKVEYGDIISINKMLKTSPLVTVSIIKGLFDHLSKEGGLALKLVNENGEIVGVWFSLEFAEYVSLSHLYVVQEVRNTRASVGFFKECFKLLGTSKPVLLEANDVSLFRKRVENIEGDLYVFVGGKK